MKIIKTCLTKFLQNNISNGEDRIIKHFKILKVSLNKLHDCTVIKLNYLKNHVGWSI